MNGTPSVSTDILYAGIWTLDRDGITTSANPRMHEIIGVESPELIGRPLLDFVEPADHHLILSGLRRRAEGRSDSYDARLRHRDGRLVEVRIHASPVLDADGVLAGSTAVVVDISDLAAASTLRDEALLTAEQSASLATNLLSLASHELRTPLNTIAGFAQLLSLGIADPHQRDMAEKIVTAANFINELCTDFIAYAHVNAGAHQLRISSVRLAPLVESALAVAGGTLERHHCSVNVTGDTTLEAIADPERVTQILVNLITNAAKHGGDDQTITIDIGRGTRGDAQCSVTDEGPGIAAHQHERVFMPFERLGNSRADGSGLGLSISRTLATAMGGDITVASELGTGATFSLHLPASNQGRESSSESDRGLILYVEDEPLNASLVENIVAMLPGRRVKVVGTVADGIEAANSLHPALVLLDLHLPDGTGLDVLTAIRRNHALADLPVFMLSADATEESTRAALEQGANRYITKPFDLRTFLDLLEMATSATK